MKPRTVTMRFETYAEAKREPAKRQAKQARLICCVLAIATVLGLGCRRAWPQPPSNVFDIAWSPDGRRLATIGFSYPGVARVWDAETGKELLSLSLHIQSWIVTWSPDVRRLATATGSGVEVWDAERGEELLTVGAYGVRTVAWSPDGKRLATGSHGQTAKVWDAETGKELLSLSGQANSISDMAWSPDGKKLAAASGDQTVKVWDTETGKELLTLSGHTNRIVSVAWSPDSKRLATGSDDQTAKVWEAETGKESLTLSGHRDGVSSVTWSPDGTRLATGSYDGKAKLWDADSGQELLTLSSHSGRIFSVAWSPDGRRLATGSDCNTVRLWNTETGKKLLTLEGSFQGCEEMSEGGGPTVTLGIEIELPSGGIWPVAVDADHAVFYIPAVGAGEELAVIPVSNGRYAGIRITPSMGEDSVKIDVAALVKANKNLSDATCNEVRAWHSTDAGSYEGRKDESLSLSGLARLGLPVFKLKVVQAKEPPPGGFHHPYAGYLAHCDCEDTRDELNASINFLAYPGSGKCAEIGKCGHCCRIVPPSDAHDVPR